MTIPKSPWEVFVHIFGVCNKAILDEDKRMDEEKEESFKFCKKCYNLHCPILNML